MPMAIGRIRGGKCYRQGKAYHEYIRKRDNHMCQLCGKPGYDVDHIVPYAISGESRPAGMRVLCHKCNVATRRPRKDARLPYEEWLAHVESLRGTSP